MRAVILYGQGGELDREPITDDHTDAVKEAIERLVDRVGFFAGGDTIKVIEQE